MKRKNLFYPFYVLFAIAVLLSHSSYAADDFGEINKTDAKGQRQGYWIIKGDMVNDAAYKPESKVEEGRYSDNRKDGLWKKYWPNGKLRSAINYQQGKPSGEYELYYENGITEEHGFWANNKNINDFKRFYENGNPQQHFLFADNGKRNGMQKYYHENGRMALEVNIVNGAESGVMRRYNPDGTLIEEKVFENGIVKQTKKIGESKPQGVATKDPYDKNVGTQTKAATDKTNAAETFKPNGFNTLYNKNGDVTQSGEFKDGRLFNGKWYRYSNDGILIRIEIYRGGTFIGTGVIGEEEK